MVMIRSAPAVSLNTDLSEEFVSRAIGNTRTVAPIASNIAAKPKLLEAII